MISLQLFFETLKVVNNRGRNFIFHYQQIQILEYQQSILYLFQKKNQIFYICPISFILIT
jgi:hypothetical protein